MNINLKFFQHICAIFICSVITAHAWAGGTNGYYTCQQLFSSYYYQYYGLGPPTTTIP